MGLPLSFVVAIVVFLPCVQSLDCGSGYDVSYCFPGDYQTAYCCGYSLSDCCYTSNVVALWWFWVVLVIGITILISCCVCCCRYSRRSRPGYTVVQGQPAPITTIVQSNQSHVTGQFPQHSGYPQSYGAVKVATGPPPPYAYPPTAPQQQPHYF